MNFLWHLIASLIFLVYLRPRGMEEHLGLMKSFPWCFGHCDSQKLKLITCPSKRIQELPRVCFLKPLTLLSSFSIILFILWSFSIGQSLYRKQKSQTLIVISSSHSLLGHFLQWSKKWLPYGTDLTLGMVAAWGSEVEEQSWSDRFRKLSDL